VRKSGDGLSEPLYLAIVLRFSGASQLFRVVEGAIRIFAIFIISKKAGG
jgi:hypothetical protein